MIEQIIVGILAMAIMFVGCVIAIAVRSIAGQFTAIILTIIALAIVGANCHAMSFKRAKILFANLQNVSGKHVQLYLDDDVDYNACGIITLNEKLVEVLKND